MNTIQPYETGNFAIWALKELNDRDKHKLLIPTFKVMTISGIYLRNKDQVLGYNPIFTTETCRKRIEEMLYGRNPQVENKGKATTGIAFESGVPYEGVSVVLALDGIAEEITRTIKAFEILLTF